MIRLIRFRVIGTIMLMITTPLVVSSQNPPSFRINAVNPYDKAVPGQILGLRVEGLQVGPPPMMMETADFKIEIVQDGVTLEAKVRTVTPTMTFTRSETIEETEPERKFLQTVKFVVPRGLHPGESELRLSFRNQWSNSVNLTILDQPMRPVVGTMSVLTMGGVTPESVPGTKPVGNDLGWRLERAATTRINIEPLVDPEDAASAIIVRFKQGDALYDAVTRVTSRPFNVQNRRGSVSFLPSRDELELDVPAALAMGPAEAEIRVKANGKTSNPVTVKVTITDTTRTIESPGTHAPRLLAVTPKRTGAGQSILLSVDQRRALEPDPAKTIVFIEQNGALYAATIERNSALTKPNPQPYDPVALIVRTSRQIVGPAQVRVFNSLRGESAGSSEPVQIEILQDVQPPEVFSVGESTEADLAALRRMYEIQRQAGRQFPEFDPSRRYLTIRTTGIDYNPQFIRITLEQAGRGYTLSFADFSSFAADTLIVRLPGELRSGTVNFSIANLGIGNSSTPVMKTFSLR